MGKKSRKKKIAPKTKSNTTQLGWIVITEVALIVSVGLIAKLVWVSNDTPGNTNRTSSVQSKNVANPDARIQLVASRFRCACGGCGELPLDECTCDMPRGAVEEKNFIRNQLQHGLTIDQVVKRVNEKYGHMKT